ncbi:Crp/Fnr family transcriptional regulator [uncultured Allomuricauda sp.]|uniref:Crp/Fnr family transcriptional regulator n=1 Tax=Flagellimonas sp. W118 TaxID=3410791 RepID=UPI00261E5B88|nr:Crp/Fnr family transcriptional regulator [uncultured Allomuricauda sp.]
MSQQLFEHLNRFVQISKGDFKDIIEFFEVKKVEKKEVLARAGTLCNSIFFVEKGCLRMYFISEKGIEQTIQFALENWWMTDDLAYTERNPSDFYIQAVENAQVLSISYDQQERLLHTFPQLEKYFRRVYQIAYGSSIRKMKYLNSFSKEEIYFHFTAHFPEFAQRVPQYLIASFLGLTPEYVSEIRAKKRS